jgi:hypothetical protein
VESAAAIVRDVPLYIDAVGKIAAREVVTIQPQVSGRITEIHFADGAEVKAGQALSPSTRAPSRRNSKLPKPISRRPKPIGNGQHQFITHG